ncbi:MAG: hypothetical protein WC522_05070 [Candidatus Omnitrophota bacterium]
MKIFSVLFIAAIAVCIAASAAVADMNREDVINSARKALADRNIKVVDCNVVYDEGNKAWAGWGDYVARMPNDKNHGYLPHGILKKYKYQAVYFDFYDDARKDIWVFVDANTGNGVAVYEKK